jgi:hypothetical protein
MLHLVKNLFGGRRNSQSRGMRQSFRPTLEVFEDRLMPSTLGLSGLGNTAPLVGAPAAPGITASAVSATQINLAWNSVAGASGYLADEWVNGAWQQIGSFGSGSTGCSVNSLSPNTTYYFDVGAYDYTGTSWADYTSASTLQAGPPPAPSFTATAASATQINLAWTPVAGATGYLVDEFVNGAWKQIGSFGSGSTGCSVTGLSPSTTYYFDVAASNASGTSWASYQGATTSANTVTIDHPAASGAYSRVTGMLFGTNGPSYRDVQQGGVGDCWLLSSLAEVADRAPQDIRNMFTYTGTTVENGATVSLYKVRLFDNSGTAHYLTVDTELPSGGNTYDHPANGVLWVALAEKAYAEANGQGFVTTGHNGSDSYSALDEGDPRWALTAITGKSASDFSINPSNIAAAWNAGELIVMCTSNPSSPYIVPSHCYAVVSYTPSSSQPFKVYNPWGANSSGWALGNFNGHQVYGLFNATAGFLAQNFTSQSFDYATANGTDANMRLLSTGTEDGTGGHDHAGHEAVDLFFAVQEAELRHRS